MLTFPTTHILTNLVAFRRCDSYSIRHRRLVHSSSSKQNELGDYK